MSAAGTERQSIQKREVVHRGPVFAVEVCTLKASDGSTIRRDIVRHPGAVTIVAALDDSDSNANAQQILLIRNYRIAVNERLIELPAGKLEPDEQPLAAAARELIEETGYRAGELTPLGQFYTSPGFADELMHVFLATRLVHVGQQLEAGEDIELLPVPVDEVMMMIADGRIRDGKTIAALTLWQGASSRTGDAS